MQINNLFFCPLRLSRLIPVNIVILQPDQLNIYTQILTRYWGFASFKPMQEEIINSIASGKDTLALLPTGGGKSITFQVPALAKDGICIVVTPLIALMRDQVENLLEKRN
jgi:ATP-dependent DNA helicase RecQ